MTDLEKNKEIDAKLTKVLFDIGCKKHHIKAAIDRAEVTGESLPAIMKDFGFLSGEQVAEALAKLTGLRYYSSLDLDSTDFSALSKEFEIKTLKGFCPLGVNPDGSIQVGVSDISLINQAKNKYFEYETEIVVASFQTIQAAYRQHFAKTEAEFDKALNEFLTVQNDPNSRDASGAMIKVFNSLLKHTCYSGASDLYLYKSEEIGVIRLKINGTGRIFRSIPIDVFDRIMNKLVTENVKAEDLLREPQEAQIQIVDDTGEFEDIANRYSFRLELAQTRNDAKTAVVRVLDRQSSTNDIDKLGFDEHSYSILTECANTPTGLIVVTGPTGSGKTSSLYALLKSIDPVERSVQSIENPIEFRHGLWMQYELPKTGSGTEGEKANKFLKALLRNAPDVILMGETRDAGVAKILLDAANTGHLVFTTLHTNTAATAVARLKDLGVEMDSLASVLLCILAQRLVQVLCPQCKIPDQRESTHTILNVDYIHKNDSYKPMMEGDGCPSCDYGRYRGRRMIYEVLHVNSEVRRLIEKNSSPSMIAEKGIKHGMSMWSCGLKLVAKGITSIDEVKRRASPDDN